MQNFGMFMCAREMCPFPAYREYKVQLECTHPYHFWILAGLIQLFLAELSDQIL